MDRHCITLKSQIFLIQERGNISIIYFCFKKQKAFTCDALSYLNKALETCLSALNYITRKNLIPSMTKEITHANTFKLKFTSPFMGVLHCLTGAWLSGRNISCIKMTSFVGLHWFNGRGSFFFFYISVMVHIKIQSCWVLFQQWTKKVSNSSLAARSAARSPRTSSLLKGTSFISDRTPTQCHMFTRLHTSTSTT